MIMINYCIIHLSYIFCAKMGEILTAPQKHYDFLLILGQQRFYAMHADTSSANNALQLQSYKNKTLSFLNKISVLRIHCCI